MNAVAPHYLLFCDLGGDADPGRWRFVLRAIDGSYRLEADDVETDARGERLELLTVVRGLEALDQASRVTLISASSYVREGIRRGIDEWRRNGWRWECFGQMVPVKDTDLWQRIDRAMQFHQIDCRSYRLDPPQAVASPHQGDEEQHPSGVTVSPPAPRRLKSRRDRIATRVRRWLAAWRGGYRLQTN